MSAMDRALTDRFWPVFAGCLAIGVSELGAVACVCIGKQELAEALDVYWELGFVLSFWLWSHSDTAATEKRGGIQSRTLGEASLFEWIAIVGVILAVVIVLGSDRLLPTPWSIVVHGGALGPYLIVSCWFAWRRDHETERTDSADRSE